MEGRAPGGELKKTPLEWLEWLSMGNDPAFSLWLRASKLPPRPITRFEYFEAIAFSSEEDEDGDMRAV